MGISIFLIIFLTLTTSWQLTTCSRLQNNFNDWFYRLNSDLNSIYQKSANFAWDLSVNPTHKTAAELRQFNANKSKWRDSKCLEIQELITLANQYPLTSTISNLTILNTSARLLCAGPKFNEKQTDQLTFYLQQMQTIFTTTEICLPQQFDVCLNLDRIWEFTYVLRNGDHIEPLCLDAVKPKVHVTKLNLYDGSIQKNYYVNGVSKITQQQDRKVERELRVNNMICLGGEEEFDRIMSGDFIAFNRSDCALRFNEIFRWAWESWRTAVGNKIGTIYGKTIDLMNIGAKANGYNDIGEVWRQEVDLPNLSSVIDCLMQQIKPIYQLLHGVLRNVLWNRIHKFEPFNKESTIPAHMLGSLWSQNWQTYQNLILPFNEFQLDQSMKNLNWTIIDMVKKADDFYRSLSLPPMPEKFWQKSIFEKSKQFRNCHGTAANMFDSNDYRMIVCAEQTVRDFGVIVHEMGHLQYFMAYKNQPTVFQDGNAAIQESIGDAIFLGIMTPHHLNRLNLLPDKYLMSNKPSVFTESMMRIIHSRQQNQRNKAENLNADHTDLNDDYITVNGKPYPKLSTLNQLESEYSEYESKLTREINDFDLALLLHMALHKIPAIPFQYLMDAFRWQLFNGTVSMNDANALYWNLALNEQGIHPPDWKDRHEYFDLGAKFHISDNTPFTRYFLASFIQAQIFEGLCKVTIFDTVKTKKPLPMPLHRCDIYGSKRAGKLIKKALQLGSSKHWTEILYMLTGSREVRADALLLYYKPLISWLNSLVEDFNIPIGW
ncbi:angiotensin-converting enzyme-like isoform X2 [Contarinia nasturtii]|uniref:angiotensin-converting enzyme-like isoform X2 n=1 Tax=Contarinia nasturtii TaxID=265458 RepID=UPI0012D4546F|nr:angiotensin-converting enzyme-like isoform X2 [Contarinia nasturtii]